MSYQLKPAFGGVTLVLALFAVLPPCAADVRVSEPTRIELEELIRTIARDPVTPELIDTATIYFRRNWTCEFRRVVQLCTDPEFVRRIDAAYHDVLGRPASTLGLLSQAIGYHVGYDDRALRCSLRKNTTSAKAAEAKTFSVRGTVVDEETKKSLADVLVYAGRGARRTLTDTDGHFELNDIHAPDGNISVFVEASGFGLAETLVDAAEAAANKRNLTFAIVKSAPFEGKVVDSDGRPVVGAGLAAWIDRSLICRDGSLKSSASGGNAIILTAMSDAEGRFVFGDMPRGANSFTLDVSHHQHQHQSVRGLSAPTADGMPVVVTLQPGCEVSGIVVDAEGEPVSGAWVLVQTPGSGGYFHDAHTNMDGRFAFRDVAPGSWDIMAKPEKHAASIATVTATLDQPVRDLRIVVKQGQFISGIVLDPEGKPVADAFVGWVKPIGSAITTTDRMTATDSVGSFRIGPLPPANEFELTALVDPPRFIGKANGIGGQKNLVIRLNRDSR